jgi:hypothetical protein
LAKTAEQGRNPDLSKRLVRADRYGASPELEVQPGVVNEVTLQRDYDIETLVQ